MYILKVNYGGQDKETMVETQYDDHERESMKIWTSVFLFIHIYIYYIDLFVLDDLRLSPDLHLSMYFCACVMNVDSRASSTVSLS